ncbi:putative G-protein coupled receptor 112, partial [Stegodyphus mimosarum]
MMNAIFLTGAAEPANGGNACAAVGLFLHYFVLTSLTWMCVEAINMYQLLVHVFASSETHFLLKRCFFAWGGPLVIVALTASFGLDSYYDDLEFCMLSPRNPWIYYCAFLAPSCILLAVNFTVFILVSRVIFTPRLTTKTSNNHQVVTAAQVRGAFTVMVLLGVTWVFGTMAFGHVKIIFQYFFCISNSLQGFLIFLVRCLLYPEARNAWFYLLKTGKLKKHRGIMPPGTVSFSTNSQGGKNPVSTINTAARNDSNEDYGSIAFDSSLFNRKERKQENHKSSQDTSSLRWHKNFEASYQHDRNGRTAGWKKQESKLHRNSKKNAKNNNQTWNQQNGEMCVKGQCESPGIWSVHGKEVFRNGQIGSHINVRPPHFDKQLFKAPFQNEQFGSNVKNLCNTKSSRFSPDNGDKLEHLDLPEKESMVKSDFNKDRRSLSLDVPCGLNSNRNTVSINSTYPTIEGFKHFLSSMRIRSPDGIGKDKRSLSLDTGTPESIPRTEVGREMQNNIKKDKFGIDIGFSRRNSIVLEQDEDAPSDENSASTDVEDSPPTSVTKSSHSSHASFGLQGENKAASKSCRKNSRCFRQDLEEGSSLQHISSASPKKSYVDIVK